MTQALSPQESSGEVPLSSACTIRNALYGSFFFAIVVFFFISSFSFHASDKPSLLRVTSEGVETVEAPRSESFLLSVMVMALIGSVWSLFFAFFSLKLGSKLIPLIFAIFILFTVFGGVLKFADDSEVVGVALMVLSILSGVFFLTIRNELNFLRANLRIACASILSHPSVIYIAVGALLALFLWGGLWMMTFLTIGTNLGESSLSTSAGNSYSFSVCTTYEIGYHANLTTNNNDIEYPLGLNGCDVPQGCLSCYCDGKFIKNGSCFQSTYYIFYFFLFLFCLFYVSLVLSNFVHCVSASVTIAWWMRGAACPRDVYTACKNSTSRWLGPLCVASLLVPPIRVCHSIVYISMVLLGFDVTSGRPKADSAISSHHVLKLGEMMYNALDKLENSVVSYNRYALSYIAKHPDQYDFSEASHSVANMFSTRRFTGLVHDSVMENLLVLASISGGTLLLLLASFYVDFQKVDMFESIYNVLPLVCFVFGYVLSYLALQLLLGAYTAVIVCLVGSPDSLQTNHPEHFEPLMSAWRKSFPEANVTFFSYSSVEFPQGSPAYVPPSTDLKKMTTVSNSAQHNSSTRQSSKYHKLSNHESDDESPVEKDGSQYESSADSMLESYAASQLPMKNNFKLYVSQKSDASGTYDADDDEFVL